MFAIIFPCFLFYFFSFRSAFNDTIVYRLHQYDQPRTASDPFSGSAKHFSILLIHHMARMAPQRETLSRLFMPVLNTYCAPPSKWIA